MKYKALAISFLLLMMPMFAITAFKPAAAHNIPWNVDMYTTPDQNFTGPCKVSTNFAIDVFMDNWKNLSGVGVYAYDFYVYWRNDVGISLVGFVNHIPWPTGKAFLIVNGTGTFALNPVYDFYHVAVTAIGNSTLDPTLELGYLTEFKASLVTLTFHIDDEPFYPDTWSTYFLIGNKLGAQLPPATDPTYFPLLSTGCTVQITNIELEVSQYNYKASQPNIDPEASMAPPFPANITVNAIGKTETVYVVLTNITKAYGFYFELDFDPAWKQTDIQHVTILPAFPPPYEVLQETVDNNTGVIKIELMKPCEKPTVCGAVVPVVKIDFVSTLTPEVGKIPFLHTGVFHIPAAAIAVKNDTGSYEYWMDNAPWLPGISKGWPTLLYSGDLGNDFKYKSLADITLDGAVDIGDLSALAKVYGTSHHWGGLVGADPSVVDIYDFVFVAKHFGDDSVD
jgi:hypothetical protein